MAIKDVVKYISKTHFYRVSTGYWGRIGSMYKKYGELTMMQAIEELPEQEIPLTALLNIIEKKCQYIIENGELDDFANELLNIVDDIDTGENDDFRDRQ